MTYSYKCDQCGYVLIVTYSLSEEKPGDFNCICGGKLRRVYEPPAIKFKGSGFYANDQLNDPDEDLDIDA